MFDHIALHLFESTHLTGQMLTFGATLPSDLASFVAADMNVFRGKEFHDLGQDILCEAQCGRIAYAKLTGRIGPSRAAEFGITYKYLIRVCRKLDLWNHIDMSPGSIANDLPNILLRIVTAVSTRRPFRQILTVATIPPLPPIRFGAEGRFRSKFRIFVYLDTPSSGIRQMHMQGVQLVKRHHIQQFHHFLFGEEMTGYIQMQSPIPKTRIIPDRNTWDLSSGIELA